MFYIPALLQISLKEYMSMRKDITKDLQKLINANICCITRGSSLFNMLYLEKNKSKAGEGQGKMIS